MYPGREKDRMTKGKGEAMKTKYNRFFFSGQMNRTVELVNGI